MYPEQLVAPMRTDLTSAGFVELKSAEEVDKQLQNQQGTMLLVINSVCGCAAGAARHGVKWALDNSQKRPDTLATVVAGVDKEAVARAREDTLPYPPSSSSIALIKDSELVHLVERHHFKRSIAQMIGQHMVEVFEEYC